jgi:hypothetical protein
MTLLKTLPLLIVLLLTSTFASAIERRQLTGRELTALTVAAADFKRHKYSKSGNLSHYSIEFERRAHNVLEITFLADDPSPAPNHARTGGGSIYGTDVTYFVSLDRLKILSFHFSR